MTTPEPEAGIAGQTEPYENTLSVEQLRSEVRQLWDRAHAFRDDINTLPEVPSIETLWHLQGAASGLPFRETWEIGKQLQQEQPYGAVPWKTELECAAGLWVMIREGILASQHLARAQGERDDA